MKTILVIAIVTACCALVSRLFSNLSCFRVLGNEKGSCTEEDYKIASQLETRNN